MYLRLAGVVFIPSSLSFPLPPFLFPLNHCRDTIIVIKKMYKEKSEGSIAPQSLETRNKTEKMGGRNRSGQIMEE